MGSETTDRQLADAFSETLRDCQAAYRRGAARCLECLGEDLPRPAEEIDDWMADLHRGLLIKIYMEIALADQQWSLAERDLAERLFAHLWQQKLQGERLREAMKQLSAKAQSLSWKGVLQPFVEFACLREEHPALIGIIFRLAHLIAKIDGTIKPTEQQRIDQLRASLDRLLTSAGIHDGPPPLPNVTSPQNPSSSPFATASRERPRPATPPTSTPAAPVSLEATLQKLEKLVGLATVKDEVRTLTNFLKIQHQRQLAGLPTPAVGLHLVFAGDPGTGKTTVARIVGEVYGALGVLGKGHLIETDRAGLVAEYAGQTAPKTNATIDRALDGVLFIDEAYGLIADQADDPYGREAMQTLLKRMEDDRNRLAVILAGYTEPMDRLLKSNPGLSSRFARTLGFADYEPVELARIFERLCDEHHYRLTSDVRQRLLLGLHHLYEQRDEHFGNGRLVRNLFEDAIRRMANRIADQVPLTRQLLTEFHRDDLAVPGVASSYLASLETNAPRFRLHCPGCGKNCQLRGDRLGRRVRCPQCQLEFTADWGKLDANS